MHHNNLLKISSFCYNTICRVGIMHSFISYASIKFCKKEENHRFMLNKGSWPDINFYIFVYISTLFGICKKYWERKALTKLAFLVTESLWSRKFTETHRNRFKDIWWLSSLFRAGFSLVSYRHVCTHVYTCSTLYICGY